MRRFTVRRHQAGVGDAGLDINCMNDRCIASAPCNEPAVRTYLSGHDRMGGRTDHRRSSLLKPKPNYIGAGADVVGVAAGVSRRAIVVWKRLVRPSTIEPYELGSVCV